MKIFLLHLFVDAAWCFVGYRWFKYGRGSFGPSGQRFVMVVLLFVFLWIISAQSTIVWYRSAVHDLLSLRKIDPTGFTIYGVLLWCEWTILDDLIKRDSFQEEFSWLGEDLQSRLWRMIGIGITIVLNRLSM